ncbi:MAG: GAF domain-containing protein [Enhydrobacter sp.]|nr:GAF domain-containing protein [Enhydrobacter sp.]
MSPLDTCIAALRSGPTDALFDAVEKATAAAVGHKLFTLLYVAPNGKRVKRLYTNMPNEYPVGGYKEVTDTPWRRQILQEKRAWIGFDAGDIKSAFLDYELILSLGCESAMNVPVVYNGRLLGTMNLLDAKGHYTKTDPDKCALFAALLVGPFLDAIAADPG